MTFLKRLWRRCWDRVFRPRDNAIVEVDLETVRQLEQLAKAL